MNISSKVALVTGAAEGLGKAFAEELLRKAAKAVSIVDINPEKGLATEEEFKKKYGHDRAVFMQCDVSSSDQLKDVFKKTKDQFGALDIVVNNAGIMDEKNWSKMLSVNLKACIDGTYIAQEHLSKQNGNSGGVVVNIASLAGIWPGEYAPVYSATKHGVVAFSRSLVKYHPSFTPDDVRLNILCPPWVETSIISKGIIDADDKTREMLGKMYKFIPMEEVVAAFIRLIEEPLHGEVIKLTVTSGAKIVHFPRL